MTNDVGVEAIAVITGSFLSGAMMSVYLLAIPSLFETTTDPGHLVRHWHRIFMNGHIKGPIISLTTTALYGLAALAKYNAGQKWGVFATAGATTIAMVPFTLTIMASTNEALFRMEAEVQKGRNPTWGEAERLVRNWSRFNLTRAFFPLAGAVLGLLATLKLVSF
ncbi:hypothetical protein HK57_00553 [Aspergillus ustus]|uniref:DUF1772-domain-containing protein n=1 Tax=Aspergillus ustus TaxID=40382 RepID=A0A0C1BVT9_ASPUT|nr:hypothetical protein HK57_00553 [Aspergillus ustus]